MSATPYAPRYASPRDIAPAELRAALDRLDALFSGPETWTQDAMARDENGVALPPTPDNDARQCSFSLDGAIARLHEAPDVRQEVLCALGFVLGFERWRRAQLAEWNDAPERTFADIKNVIAAARQRLGA